MPQDSNDPAHKARIRELNDQLRQVPFDTRLGQVVLTTAVADFLRSAPELLPKEWLARRLFLLRALAAFDAFDETNDPTEEHHFGLFEVWDRTFFFKIDYYDTAGRKGSPDPANPAVTRRVLTIGFPEDY